jgi:hypothetical protein
MRLTLLAAVLLFSLHTCLAVVPLSASLAVVPPVSASLPVVPVSASLPVDSTAKSPVNNTVHGKGKGTVGFISGLLLGPVGLGGVYLFSHNRAQRKAAKKGCIIFATAVVVAALCWLIVLGAKNGGGFGSISSNRSGGSGSRSSGGSGSSSSVGSSRASGSGGSHSSNSNWASNLNFPGSGSSSTSTKKPVTTQLPVDWPSLIFLIH